MKAYIINLKTSTDRKRYMENLLIPYNDFLDVHFVEAVDGRQLSDEQLSKIWDQKATYKNYGRNMNNGEIGCSLSHRKCYEEMLKNDVDMAMVLEDDAVFKSDANLKELISALKKALLVKKPVVILLTGSYWFTGERNVLGSYARLASVFEAMGTVAYMLNQAAAKRMFAAGKEYLADDWYNWKRNGIKVYALRPHIAGDMDLFGSVIAAGSEGWKRENLSFKNKIRAYYRGIIRRYLGSTGHWEARK